MFAGGLEPPSSATVVDATGTDVLVTDGPYAEAKEQLGGFWIIEAPDLDAALAISKRASAACMGPWKSVRSRPRSEPRPHDPSAPARQPTRS